MCTGKLYVVEDDATATEDRCMYRNNMVYIANILNHVQCSNITIMKVKVHSPLLRYMLPDIQMQSLGCVANGSELQNTVKTELTCVWYVCYDFHCVHPSPGGGEPSQ